MKIYYKNLTIINITVLVLFVFIYSNTIIAQSNSFKNLVDKNEIIEDSIAVLNIELDNLQNLFKQLNSEIYQLKTNLRKNNNPIKRLKLDGKLKESLSYADRIKQLNIQIENFNIELKSNYKKIINNINHLINIEIKKFNSTDNSFLKTSIIEKVNKYEEGKQIYYKILNEEITTVNEDNTIVINPNDNVDRLNLKIDLIKDRLNFLYEEKIYLLQKKEEFNSDRLMYIEMSDFLNDLKRNIDEEQEFYDPDRAEQINIKIKNIESKIKNIEERLTITHKGRLYYKEKLKKFNNYKKLLITK